MVAPAATVTLAGTVAADVLLLDSVTLRCAAVPAAGAFSVSVAVELAVPPTTLVGLGTSDTTSNGFTVNVAVADPFKVAVITELAAVLTTSEVTVNVAVVAPAATVTLAGTVAADVLLLDSGTLRSAAVPAAGAFSVNVAVEWAVPPTTLVGLSVKDTTPGGGVTVSAAVCVRPFSIAEIFAVSVTETL